MPKKPFVWLTVMLSMLLPLVAACGSTPSTSTNTSHATTPPGGENLYVLDGYTPTVQSSNSVEQHIIVFHPGSTNPAMTLPLGLTSMDHQRLFATRRTARSYVHWSSTGPIRQPSQVLTTPCCRSMDTGWLCVSSVRQPARQQLRSLTRKLASSPKT